MMISRLVIDGSERKKDRIRDITIVDNKISRNTNQVDLRSKIDFSVQPDDMKEHLINWEEN